MNISRIKTWGGIDSLHGTLNEVNYDFFCMKESDYTMKIMSTYDGLTIKEGQRNSKRNFAKDGTEQTINFKCTEPFANHFDYHHIVDDRNNLRRQTPSIEET